MYRKVIKKLENYDIDAYLIRSEANKNYLCNKENYFFPANILVTKKELFVVTNSRNFNFIEKTYNEYNVIKGNINDIVGICKKLEIKSIGYESDITSKNDYENLKETFENIQLVDVPEFIEDLRMVKTEEEIKLIDNAISVANKGFYDFLNYVKSGMTEKQARNIFQDCLMRNGADKLSFDVLLSSGERCFIPHSTSSDKIIRDGDFVLIDFGVMINGYCSDTTRTIVVGNASDRQKEIYDLVLDAQSNALNNIHAGMTCSQADALARDVIKSKIDEGCYDYGLGHGVGLCVHEKPRMRPGSSNILVENSVVSVEPGIYIEGFGGVRIEDLLVIGKEKGGRSLIRSTRELLEIK